MPDTFRDFRGRFVETYNKELYEKNGIDVEFIQDDVSVSKKNVLRGIHGDNETWKLASCLYGKLYFVAVNCDESSRNFGEWQNFILSDENGRQILIPPKYGSSYLVQSEVGIFSYKQSTYYVPGRQFTYKWDDPRFNIKWPIKNPILSKRDKAGHYV